MKKILILSDTHGYIDDRIEEYAKNSDETWHAGDFGSLEVLKKLEKVSFFSGVYGNIDNHVLRRSLSEFEIFEVEKLKILLIHIAGNSKNLSFKARSSSDKSGQYSASDWIHLFSKDSL